MKTINALLVTVHLSLALTGCGGGSDSQQGSLETLGRKIFFDDSLSEPRGQACATCHNQTAGFSDPTHAAASVGAVTTRRGSRNAIAIAYSLFSPPFKFSSEEEDFVGGQFWDGAASTLVDQAKRPFFSSREMNLPSPSELARRLSEATYASEITALYGDDIFLKPDSLLTAAAQALEAFESGHDFRAFNSKYDRWVTNEVELSPEELRGLQVFEDPQKGNCAACHLSTSDNGARRSRALFTDFTYDNIGLPPNTAIRAAPDKGLEMVTERPEDRGRFKVPTLRNVAVSSPYFHNGVFATLEEVVHFYNARDVDPRIAPPEFPETMNRDELGDLRLTEEEERDLVAFLKTLTDHYELQ